MTAKQNKAQINLFDSYKVPLKINKPIRLIELFAGVGSQAKALKRLGADFEHYRICEFDKYAIKSYNAIHGTDFVTSDITQITADDLGIVDTDKFYYIMTYSFPCQDLSLAGKGNGMAKGSGTRSGLLWEVERLLNECTKLPQILLMENVTQVHGKKNIEHFNEWIDFLESKGYSNYWQDLNAKNYGIPQNRDRTFMVSVLGEYTYEFPEQIPLVLRLKNILQNNVDEKYYLNDKQITYILDLKGVQIGTKWENSTKNSSLNKNVAMTIGCRSAESQRAGITNYIIDNVDGEITVEEVKKMINAKEQPILIGGNLEPKIVEPLAYDEQNGYIRKCGTVGTLTTDGSSPKHNNRIIEPQINVVGNYSPSGHDASRIVDSDGLAPTVKENHGTVTAITEPIRVWDGFNQRVRADSETVGTLTQNCGADLKRNGQGIIESPMRIRKLTPLECWRLMGFDDEDFYKAEKFNSNAQLYKQAGNSIVVDVLYYIFRQMF